MADAVVSNPPIREVAPKPTNPSHKPSKAVSITFDGVGDTSTPIEKQNFGLVDLSFPTGTAVLTFLVAHTVGGTYRLLDGESFDTAAVNTGNTSKLAGYGFFKVKQDSAESMVVEAGMI